MLVPRFAFPPHLHFQLSSILEILFPIATSLMQGKEQLRRYFQGKLRIDQDPPPPRSLPDGKGPPNGSGLTEEGKGGDGASGGKSHWEGGHPG